MGAGVHVWGSCPAARWNCCAHQTSRHRADLVAAWEVVRAAFGDHDAPSTLLGVALLGYPEQLVEVEAIAHSPR
jgi:hypothetical protein